MPDGAKALLPGGLLPGGLLGLPDVRPPPASQLNHAIDLLRAGDVIRAHDLMRSLAKRLPDWDDPGLRLADSLRARGDRAAAMEAYRTVLALNPNRVQALLALGALSIEAARPRDAIAPLLRCCGIAPDNLDALILLAQGCTDAGDPGMALAALTRAQKLAPRLIPLLPRLVAAATAAGAGMSEIARLEAMSLLDPLNPVAHIARGLILDQMGLLDPAIDALEAAVALAPGAKEPARILAGVLSHSTRAGQAEAALRQARDLDPSNPQLLNDHAAVLVRLHRHAEAAVLLREVLWSNGTHASVLCNLATATACLGQQDAAVELVQAAIALDREAVMPRRSLANALPYQDGVTGAALLRAARECAAVLPRRDLPAPTKAPGGEARTRRPRRARRIVTGC